jgi:hypothetical protein
LSSREDQPGRFRAEPEVASASGGHLAPDTGAGSLFDRLDDPLPSEVARRADPGAQTETIQRDPLEAPMRRTPEVTRQPAPRRPARRKVPMRRVKRTIKHVHPLSVLKLSVFFYACFLLGWMILGFILYSILKGLEVLKFIRGVCDAFLLEQCDKEIVTLGQFERWVLVAGLAIAAIGILMNTLMAVLYNVGADIFGGLEVTFVEKDV